MSMLMVGAESAPNNSYPLIVGLAFGSMVLNG